MKGGARGIRGILFDLDGTVYEGDRLLPGAREAVAFCRGKNLPFRFVTNTTSKPQAEVAKKLSALGLDIPADWIFTAPAAARRILLGRGFTRCRLLVRDALLADLHGIQPTDDDPQAVVVGDMGETFSYEVLNRAFRALLRPECAFFTMARNRYFRSGGELSLDVGAFVAALEYATGRSCELIGKPAAGFFHAATSAMGLQSAEVVVVGDDLESDVNGAQAAGLCGVLVRTGKFRAGDLAAASQAPDAVWENLSEFPRIFASGC